MPFKANCAISQPVDTGRFESRRDMGGFGWHPDHGIYIPVTDKEDAIDRPYPSGMIVSKISNVDNKVNIVTDAPIPQATPSQNPRPFIPGTDSE